MSSLSRRLPDNAKREFFEMEFLMRLKGDKAEVVLDRFQYQLATARVVSVRSDMHMQCPVKLTSPWRTATQE